MPESNKIPNKSKNMTIYRHPKKEVLDHFWFKHIKQNRYCLGNNIKNLKNILDLNK